MMKTVRLNVKFIRKRMLECHIRYEKDLAQMLDMSLTKLSDALLGKTSLLRPKRLAKLTEILECDIGDILEVVEVKDDE